MTKFRSRAYNITLTNRPFGASDQVIQDVLAHVYLTRPKLSTNSKFVGKAVRNHIINEMQKKQSHERNFEMYLVKHDQVSLPTADKVLETKQLVELLLQAINKLPKERQRIIESYLDCGSVVKAANKLKLNYNTAKANYRYAINDLKRIIKNAA